MATMSCLRGSHMATPRGGPLSAAAAGQESEGSGRPRTQHGRMGRALSGPAREGRGAAREAAVHVPPRPGAGVAPANRHFTPAAERRRSQGTSGCTARRRGKREMETPRGASRERPPPEPAGAAAPRPGWPWGED
ncbi:putative hydro-lyase KRH_21160 isoform X2 [Dermochelys coriacea]|uniref:putative hydro-lyase KRH_21160 isoform X2 n=1 Tax=Dermochelys coriacea TaxID=27794 RepID=UPI001CA93F3F|nr:putative hydro-lyase KRH_21160 isoform X2 [Dermochelys coriacea]